MPPLLIWLVSADGNGAGKTTRARQLAPVVFSFADAVREQCRQSYPDSRVNWYDKTQAGKLQQVVPGKTVRDCLIEIGQKMCEADPLHWAKAIQKTISQSNAEVVAVDDLRKLVELEYIRKAFKGQVIHEHVVWSEATPEPVYDNEILRTRADRLFLRPKENS